jgi:two-component system response regulator RegA
VAEPPGLSPTLLVVDDDEVFRGRLGRALGERGFEVREADSLEALERAIRDKPPEFAVVDLRLPDGTGLQAVERLLEAEASTRVVVLTGYGSIATALEAVRLGASHYLTKPATTDDILLGFARPDGPITDALPDEAPSLARVEWEHINRVLTDCDGNVSQAARVLGLHRRSLQRKLARYPSSR